MVIPSCVEPDTYLRKNSYALGKTPRAVWIGSPATERYLVDLTPPLIALNRRWGMRVDVISAGDQDLGALGSIVDRKPWGLDTFAADLSAADFGLMPLPDDPFTRGKCSYKLLQYAATGLPLVGSPVGANLQALQRLGGASPRENEWYEAIESLIGATRTQRQEMGDQARASVETHYTTASLPGPTSGR